MAVLTPSLLAGTRIMGKELGAQVERPYGKHGDLANLGDDCKDKEDGFHSLEGKSPQLGCLVECRREAIARGKGLREGLAIENLGDLVLP